MNTITYKKLREYYTQNEGAKATAKAVFGDKQPSIYRTGFYSAPSWNWGYQIGLVTANGVTYDVVTQFGAVVAAHSVNIPEVR